MASSRSPRQFEVKRGRRSSPSGVWLPRACCKGRKSSISSAAFCGRACGLLPYRFHHRLSRASGGWESSVQSVCLLPAPRMFLFSYFYFLSCSRSVGLEVRRSRSPPEFGVNIFIIRLVMVHIRRRLRKSWTRLALRSDVRGGYNARRR